MIESICSKVQILNNAVHIYIYYTLKFVIHMYVSFSPSATFCWFKSDESLANSKNMCISLFIFILYGERVPRAEHDRLSEQFLFSEVQQHNKYTTACFEWP